MKRFLTYAFVLSFSGQVAAQEVPFLGMWQMKGGLCGKIFLPDGKMYGYCMDRSFTNMSTWLMGDYRSLSDSTYQEHVFFHSTISYQRDITMSYRLVNDSLLETTYTDLWSNGQKVPMTEQWVRTHLNIAEGLGDSIISNWSQLHEEALTNFKRKPDAGKTLEQTGEELGERYQQLVQNRQLDRAYETVLVRAEMDTTNLQWQQDVLDFYSLTNSAPSMAEKITNRAIRLTTQQAPTPTDTAVVAAYRTQAAIYSKRGDNGTIETRKSISKAIEIEEASNRLPSKTAGVNYLLRAMTYMPDKDFERMYADASRAVDIFERAADTDNEQRGNGYFIKAIALAELQRNSEAIGCLNQAVPMFTDPMGQPMEKLQREIYPMMVQLYGKMLNTDANTKKVASELGSFMEDKILCADMQASQNEWGLNGTYYVMEVDDWTIEDQNRVPNIEKPKHFLLQKDGIHTAVYLKEGQKLGGAMRVAATGKKWKKQLIRNWKEYREKKK